MHYGYCSGRAIDNDDYACIHGVCEADSFDGSGYYCSDGSRCVNDGDLYNPGYVHCEGRSWSKECGGSGNWVSQETCDYGCTEGAGCNPPPPTTTTTTTTTIPYILLININIIIHFFDSIL
ncbi:MAG: hypothetical protein GF334_00525, partial [Candidatus Altiarchaeales archaeon]|nr:hypothetical protein [Candidatus Altiarchaeales archaeon]